jgi:hypothetical protein
MAEMLASVIPPPTCPPGGAMPVWFIVYAFHTIDPPARPIARLVVGFFMGP